jgi:gliding motility-associated-like protein
MQKLLLIFSFLSILYINNISAQCSIVGTNIVCVSSTVQLTGSGTAATTNPWVSSNTSIATVSSSGIVSGVSGGTVTITYTTNTGCQATKILTIQSRPTLTNILSKSICSGDNVNLPLLSNTGTATTFSWFATNNASVTGETTTTTSSNLINNTLSFVGVSNQTVNYTVTPFYNTCSGNPTQIVITVKPKAVVTIPSVTTCSGQAGTLTATPNIIGGTYNWSTGSTIATTTVFSSVTTNYTLNYAAPNGCVTTSSGTINVVSAPIVSANSLTLCANTSGVISASSTVSGGNYTWSTGGAGSQITVAPSSNTSYTVTYTLGQCSPVSASANVSISSVVSVSIPPLNICSGQSATITPTYSHSNAATYIWSTGATTASITVAPSTNTNYSVTYSVPSCIGTATGSTTMIVVQTPSVSLNSSTICAGQSVTLAPTVNPNSPNGTYSWSTGDSNPSITVNPAVTTNYSVTYTLNGCSASATNTITATPLPTITVTPENICPNTPTVLTATASPTASTFTWSTGATTSSITANVPVQSPFTVYCTNNGCNSPIKVVNISPNITLNSNINGANICPGSPYPTITITPSHPGGTYIWNTGATTNTISPTSAGNYIVTYYLTGCNSAARTITISQNNCDFSQNSCSNPNQLCSENAFTYPNATNKPDLGGIDCLGSTPNPTWFYLTVTQAGNITLNLSQNTTAGAGLDVDYIVWGPFSSLSAITGCTTGFPNGPVASCSYSANFIENATITNAQIGQTYILLVTNFSNQAGNISVIETAGTGSGSTSCSLLCDISTFTAVPSACSNGLFNLTGQLTLVNPPTTGTLTITNSCGGTQTFSAPFNNTVNYTFNQLPANGTMCNVTAAFSSMSSCSEIISYQSPNPCALTCAINNLSAVPSACNNNLYTLNGSIQFSNPPITGTLTVANSCGGTQTFNAPFVSPLSYSIPSLTATGASCTVSATFSANTTCTSSTNYTAPAACVSPCNIQSITATPSGCLNNTYSLTGSIQFSNPPTAGTLTVSNSCGGTQTFNAPFTSPLNYSLTGLTASGASCTVSATFSATTSCTFSTNYTAPAACVSPCSFSNLTAIPTTCSNNAYTLNGVVNFQNPPITGTLIVTTSTGDSQTFTAPFVSPLSYSITGLTANGTNSIVTAVFSANTSCSASANFTSPSPCVISCSIPSLTANPSACINNTFNLTGNVSFSNPPATGTLTVTNSCGGTQTFNAPFTSPISYFLSNLTANGAACNVIAIFSDNSTCTALTNYTAPAACVVPCSISNLTAIPTTCSNNAYSLNGVVTFQNPPTTGTLTVTSSSGEYQVFNAPFVSPLSYSLTGLTANGTNTTVSAEFSANTGCVASTNFTAPAPCYFPCTFQNINVTPSACSNNLYTLDGYVEFHNQPTIDSLMVVLSSGQTQTFYAPFFSPLTFSVPDLPTNGLNVSVTISFSANSACSITTNYTSPQPCFYPCAIQNVTATPSVCNNNFYSLSGAITFQHPPSYGTLTVSNSCGSTLTFNAPFTSPINYQFSNLVTDGNSCAVTASFSAATCTNSATYTAPISCVSNPCNVQSIAATPGNCVNNFFNLNGVIQFTNPPTTGILTISTGNSTITLNPPFNSPLNFTIPHLATDGLNSFVSAVFSDLNCQSTASFTAPVPCNCALNTVEVVGPENACLGQTTTLSANVSISGGTYFWYPGGETTQSIDISPTEPFTYEVYYTLFNCPEIWDGLDVGVASPVDPYFNQVPDVCMGETVSPLPLVSINDIHGTWYPPLNSNQLTTYYFIPNQGACGNIGYMNVGVVPSPTFSVAQSQAICVGDNFSYISFSSSQPGTIFNWTNSNPSIGLSASGSGDIPDFQGLNQTQQTQTATISVIATYNGCSSLPQSFDLTVKPKPDASILQSNQDLCCGSSTSNIQFSSTYSGTNFNWTNDNAAIGLPNSGQGEISSFAVTNASTSDQTTTITVVPELNGCFGDAVSTLILVHPCLDVTTANIPNYCNGQTAQSIDFVSSVSGVQYSWINSNTSIGLPVNGNGNVPSFTTINAGTSAQAAILSVTPTLNGCEGDVYNVSVTVNPTPTITVNDLTICEGLSGTITANPSTTGGSYTWTPTGEMTSSIVVSPTSNASYSVFYTLNGCSSDTLDATVDVIPSVDFTIIASGPTTINEGETVELSTSYLSASSYQWYLNGQFINGATASTYTATVAGNYTLEIVVGSCPSQSNGIPVNVTVDSDGDGVLDNTETADGTDPTNSCDFVLTNQTNVPSPTWNQGDCDADGITNQGEVTIGTNPLNSDTDGDGVMDGTEINDSTDPLNPCAFIPTSQTIPVSNSWNLSDCDSDGLSNGEENTEGTNPLNSDTDGDGVMDGTEVADGTNPLDYCSFVVANQTQTPTIAWQNVDCDFDGLINQGEINNGTNPQNPDTDGDGVNDGKEIDDQTSPTNPCSFILSSQTLVANANWNALDCDSDGLTNQEEQTLGTNPTNSDTDGDGVIDGTEVLNVTNPLLPCDLILANQTVLPSNSWNTLDCDNDSLSNEDEIAIGTDIFNPDSDGDNLSDGHEVLNGSNPLDPCDPDNTRPGCQIVTIEIDIPQIFTPNADGINETFEIPTILDYPNNTIKIFNRWGTEVYSKSPYQNEWNGTTTSNLVIGEGELPTGTYFYVLDLEGDGSKIYKGYIYLKR